MKIHGIELDEKYSPYAGVIDEYLSLPYEERLEWSEDLAGMAADDLYNIEEGLPRENGNAIERHEVLIQYFKSRGVL